MIVYGGDDQYWLGIQGYFTAYGIKLYLPSIAFGFGIFKDERDRKIREHKIPFSFINTDGKSDKIIIDTLNEKVKVGEVINQARNATMLDGDGNNLNTFQSSIVVKDICGAGNERVEMFCYDEKEGWKVSDSDLNKKVAWTSTLLTIENKLSIEHEKRVIVRLFICSDVSGTRSARVRKEILYSKWNRYDDEGLLHISNDSSNVEKELGSHIDNIIRHCDLPWKNAYGELAMRFDFFKTASSETEPQGTSSK